MHSIEFYEARKKDNFLLLRIIAACMVIYGHSFALTKGVGLTDIFLKYDWGRYSGDLAVSMFFVISGFMVSGSFLGRRNLFEYAKARLLRILPAFIVLLLVSAFLIGPLVTHLNISNYFSNVDTYKYIVKNLSFSSNMSWVLPGVFESHKMAAMNGSLWTLPAEMRMYVFVSLLGVLGLLSNRTMGTVVLFALFLAAILNPQLLPLHTGWVQVSGFFCLGILAQLYKEKIEVKHEILIMLIFLTYISRLTESYFFLLAIATAYFCFWFAYKTKHVALEKYGDPSYGIYLWGWPIQQLTIAIWPEITPWKNCIISLFFAIAMGYLSWHLVERPALSLKNKIKFRKSGANPVIETQVVKS